MSAAGSCPSDDRLTGTLPGMPITIISGPDWATIMTAFGTVGAVIAAVWIAVASSTKTNRLVEAERKEADRRLREQLDHSDEQLRKQQEHSDLQLEAERAAADERLQKQFYTAQQSDQRSQAAAVEVLGMITAPDGEAASHTSSSAVPLVVVTNKGKYAITNLAAVLSPDGKSTVDFSLRRNLADLRDLPNDLDKLAVEQVIGWLGEVYLGTIAPGMIMALAGDARPIQELKASFPIVRWIDHWGDCWEYRKGRVSPSAMNDPWL
jgi:hypothetical protein